jgi:hypothetical protein
MKQVWNRDLLGQGCWLNVKSQEAPGWTIKTFLTFGQGSTLEVKHQNGQLAIMSKNKKNTFNI